MKSSSGIHRASVVCPVVSEDFSVHSHTGVITIPTELLENSSL